MIKLTAWEGTWHKGFVRFFDPHDGRVWGLDGSPRWVVLICSCCAGEDQHFTWTVDPPDRGTRPRLSGSEKTLEQAQAKADEACLAIGWTLP